jgi:hypothetical protein
MAAIYLSNAFELLGLSFSTKNSIEKSLDHILQKVSFKIKEKFKSVTKTRTSTAIRKPSSPLNTKENTNSKFLQKTYLQTFKEKAEENKHFASKLFKDQKERKMRQEKREEKIREKLLRDLEEQKKLEELNKINFEKNKKEKINQMIEKSKERKYKLNYLREVGDQEYRKAISSTPLYKKIEQDFITKVEMPEFEKRKEELSRKREYFKPVRNTELREHAKNFDLMLMMHSQKKKFSRSNENLQRPKSLVKSKIFERLLEEEDQKLKQQEEKIIRKKNLIERQKQYAELVKEVFHPTPDILKIQELELIKARLNHPVSIRVKPIKNLLEDDSMSDNLKPKKKKVPKKDKDTKVKKIPIVKDYIQEFRQARVRSFSYTKINQVSSDLPQDLTSEQKIKKLERRVKLLDSEARKNELKIGVMSPNNPKCLEVSEHVNQLILNSIRAKLAILDTN